MHGQRRLPPGAQDEAWFQAKLQERNAKARSLAPSNPLSRMLGACCTRISGLLRMQAAKADAATKAVLKARAAGDYGPATMLGTKAVLAVFQTFSRCGTCAERA